MENWLEGSHITTTAKLDYFDSSCQFLRTPLKRVCCFWQNAWSGGYIAGTTIGELATAASPKEEAMTQDLNNLKQY